MPRFDGGCDRRRTPSAGWSRRYRLVIVVVARPLCVSRSSFVPSSLVSAFTRPGCCGDTHSHARTRSHTRTYILVATRIFAHRWRRARPRRPPSRVVPARQSPPADGGGGGAARCPVVRRPVLVPQRRRVVSET